MDLMEVFNVQDNLRGKKLLIIGGIKLACDIVEKAKEMGVYTIVTDYNEDSPAKTIADESHMVSATDIESLVTLAKSCRVDGVFTTYTDSILPYAQKVCEILDLPFAATAGQLEQIGNKRKSKRLCVEHGILVPKEFKLSSDFSQHDLKKIAYPVLTKPADNSGQRGISVCRDEIELVRGYERALEFSKSRTVVVEEYLTGEYVVMCFTLQNGYLSLSAMADKPVIGEKSTNGSVRLPKAYILPSKYLKLCYEKLYPKLAVLSKTLGLQNGSLGVEAIVKDEDFYVFEMQYRLGGMKHHDFVLAENGVDILQMHIRYALTGRFEGWDLKEKDNPYFKKSHCLLNILARPGVIAELSGTDGVTNLPGVKNFVLMHKVGDRIEASDDVTQILAKASIVCNSKDELLESVKQITKAIIVKDATGNSMLLESITSDELFDV